MSLKLYNPIQELRRHNHTFDGFYRPATDVYESKENEFIVKVNLPGFSKDEIQIDANFDELEITAVLPKVESESTSETEEKAAENVWVARHVERISRNYKRKIKFHKPVDAQQAKVDFTNGVLTITLPIRAEAQKVALKIA